MKIAITMVMALVLAAVSGCESSSERGGGMAKGGWGKVGVCRLQIDPLSAVARRIGVRNVVINSV